MNILSVLPQILIVAALAGIVIIIVRRLPEVKKKRAAGIIGNPDKKVEPTKKFSEVIKEQLFIFKKKTGEWMRTLKIKRQPEKPEIDMKAESNIETLQDAEEKTTGKPVVQKKKAQKPVQKQKKPEPMQKAVTKKRVIPSFVAEAVSNDEEIIPSPSGSTSGKKSQRGGEGRKKLQDEKKLIQRIVENPKDINSYKELAEVYIGQENLRDAIKALEEVLKLSPNDLMSEEKLQSLDAQLKEQRQQESKE